MTLLNTSDWISRYLPWVVGVRQQTPSLAVKLLLMFSAHLCRPDTRQQQLR